MIQSYIENWKNTGWFYNIQLRASCLPLGGIYTPKGWHTCTENYCLPQSREICEGLCGKLLYDYYCMYLMFVWGQRRQIYESFNETTIDYDGKNIGLKQIPKKLKFSLINIKKMYSYVHI
jgi:hypothetical protein